MVQEILQRLQALPWLAGGLEPLSLLVFCALVTGAQAVLFPVLPFAIFAGFSFGLWPGMAVIMLAKMVSAAFNFSLSRWVARGWAQRLASRHPLFQSVNEALEEEGFKMALLVRLCPVPFALANYGYGLTRVSMPVFLGATLVAALAPSLVFCGVGVSLREGLQRLGESPPPSNPWQTALLMVGLCCSAVVGRRISQRAAAKVQARRKEATPATGPQH